MSVSVNFFKHNKKINSTLLPTYGPGVKGVSVELKEVTNLFAPSLTISASVFTDSGGNITNPLEYNYCYIADFKRYYYIKNWSWILGRWECALEVDVLASFKTEIGSTTAYVLRSASMAQGEVMETKYPVIKKIGSARHYIKGHTPGAALWEINVHNAAISDGFFCVGIANDDVNRCGAVSYYAFSTAAMSEFMNLMYQSPSWMNITDTSISADLQKIVVNPLQYIVSCMWIPTGFFVGTSVGTQTIPFGWWDITLPSERVYRLTVNNDLVIVRNYQFALSNHPQHSSDDLHWLNLSPYTMINLEFPPFGMIPIDTLRLSDGNGIECSIWIDVITGKATLFIYRTYLDTGNNTTVADELIYQTVSQLGVPMALTQMAVDFSGFNSASTMVAAGAMGVLKDGNIEKLQTAVKEDKKKGIGNIISGALNAIVPGGSSNPRLQDMYTKLGVQNTPQSSSILETVKDVASDVGDALIAALGQCSSSGATGCLGMLRYPPVITEYFQYVTEMDPVHNGYPLCKSVQINTLSGFVLCGNADNFSASCMPAERQAVLSFLEGGFYYE